VKQIASRGAMKRAKVTPTQPGLPRRARPSAFARIRWLRRGKGKETEGPVEPLRRFAPLLGNIDSVAWTRQFGTGCDRYTLARCSFLAMPACTKEDKIYMPVDCWF
jgi:hypothetical protein